MGGAGERDERPAGVRRRDVLALGAGAVIGAGAWGGLGAVRDDDKDGEGEDKAEAPTAEPAPRIRRFTSTALTAVEVTTWTADGGTPAPGLLFTTPRTSVFHGLVLDDDGEPVWIEPDGRTVTDLRVQAYRGKRVLTFWAGEVATGTGVGAGVILDEHYQPVATVRAGNGATADLHEFRLSSRDTALMVCYPVVRHDLSELGGAADSFVYDCRVQEVDVASGRVLFDWSALDHLDLSETHQELGESGTSQDPYDPFHVNSVEEHGTGLLLSARHTSALYLIDRRSGEVRWRLGGKRSDFEIPEGGEFASQHDARVHPDGTLTIFDNHGQTDSETDARSAGLVFAIDEKQRRLELRQALRHEEHFGYAMGSFQVLDGGHSVANWGTDPSLTEFDADGTAVFGIDGLGHGSYRGCRAEWTGRPRTDPDIGIEAGSDTGGDSTAGDEITVCASWNGATEVARWRVLAGRRTSSLRPVATASRDGFETRVPIPRAAHVAVEAVSADGEVLGRSRTVSTTRRA